MTHEISIRERSAFRGVGGGLFNEPETTSLVYIANRDRDEDRHLE